VVTGLGVVSPFGAGVDTFEAALLTGRASTAPVGIFDATPYRICIAQTVNHELRGPGDPAVSFAVRAADEALSQAELDVAAGETCGLAMATTAVGWTAGQRLYNAYRCADDLTFAQMIEEPDQLFKEALILALASRFGLEGPGVLLSPACAAASSAIAWAAQRIRDGDVNVMLAGASDALTQVVFAGFHAMRLLSEACRPFSADRRGLVLSEGAALLVLEEEAHALARGATILARLSGWGLSCDAVHPTSPASDGILRAMTAALANAGLSADEVGQVSAHGTGSVANDAAEAIAIGALLGDRVAEVPVSAIKGTLGHTEGAAGAFAALAAVLSLQHETLPPLAGYLAPDASLPALRLATNRTERFEASNVLVNASGFGGANVSLVFEKAGRLLARQVHGERPVRHAVVTAITARSQRAKRLATPDEPRFWPRGSSLRLDRISSLVMSAAEDVLGPEAAGEIDPTTAVVLGTTYGSQARHESIWSALAEGSPHDVDPNDFAMSTFNAPGSAVASAYGFGGANLIFLGATGGLAAIDEATRQITSGRAQRVLAGAYEEVTPYFRRLLRGQGEHALEEAVALLTLEDEATSQGRDITPLARILGAVSRAPGGRWPGAAEIGATMRAALSRAGLEPDDLSAAILDPHVHTLDEQREAAHGLFGNGVTLINLAPVFGNCLAASTPLAVSAAVESAHRGCWLDGVVVQGRESFGPGRPVMIIACGLMSGCAALVVEPYANQ
jgi:3-oxoacyl-[acyl-carrier-protein] synthase II